VHGDLKPANILLDENFVTKLSDFGICRLLHHKEGSSNNTAICRTDPKGTFSYMDPEFLSTGELTPKSDVYSFGIILLRLLTARQPLGITKEVQCELDKGNLKTLLDPLAGDWPFVQAEQLAHLALRCCEMSRKNRPDLLSEVWRVLEPMKASCGGSSFFQLGSEEHFQPPSYFICPIFQVSSSISLTVQVLRVIYLQQLELCYLSFILGLLKHTSPPFVFYNTIIRHGLLLQNILALYSSMIWFSVSLAASACKRKFNIKFVIILYSIIE
jgi:serine/threonine protein kinase